MWLRPHQSSSRAGAQIMRILGMIPSDLRLFGALLPLEVDDLTELQVGGIDGH